MAAALVVAIMIKIVEFTRLPMADLSGPDRARRRDIGCGRFELSDSCAQNLASIDISSSNLSIARRPRTLPIFTP